MHGIGYFQIGFKPLLYVKINQIQIGYLPMHLQSKQADWIFPGNANHMSYACRLFHASKAGRNADTKYGSL